MGGCGERFWLRAKSTGGSAGVWDIARVGGEDAALLGTAGLPAAAGGAAPEAGSVGGRDRRHPGRRQDAASKQRHTAKRIFDRLREEHGFSGGYTIVKDYVRAATLHGRGCSCR